MAMTRRFLDWSEPVLPAVVTDLQDRYGGLGTCDLSGVIAVFPGKQAGRRFLELLTRSAGGAVLPPEIVTVGRLPEFLYQPQRPFASQLTQRLAWAKALKGLARDRLERVIAQPPGELDVDAWMALGELLRKQHRELAADLLDFADVAEKGAELEAFDESGRWQVLAEVQKQYLGLLDEYELWDQQTARLVAIRNGECRTEKDLVLVGTADLNRTLRAMLDEVSERVTAYVHAPEELSRRFDEHGCLVPEQWSDVSLDLETSQVRVVDGPAEQAETVAEELVRLSRTRKYARDDVTVSVPDDRVVPHVRRLLAQHDVPTKWVIERHLPETPPYRLLAAVADFLEMNRTDRFAALIRHPDLSGWIDRQRGFAADPRSPGSEPKYGDWLTHWDEYCNEHLQRTTDEVLGSRRCSWTARELVRRVNQLLEPLAAESRPLSDWSGPLTAFLVRVYGEVEFDQEHPPHAVILQASRTIQEACIEHASLPGALTPVVTAPQAIRLTLEQIRGEFLSPIRYGDALQLFGWLDMPMDDAPAAIVTSFNEGLVPSSVNHDLFLPNRLRAHLGIEDNARRYARDAYALSVLIHSREELRLIVAKRDVQGEPLAPSRLLFATDAKTIAERVLAFYGQGPGPDADVEPAAPGHGGTGHDGTSGFVIPRPRSRAAPPQKFRVTEFRDYLASPYRYYLRHVLRLRELGDELNELGAAAFGTLVHDALNLFAQSEARDSDDPRQIQEALREGLRQTAETQFGSDPLYPILVQIEQARHRLDAFAKWQAQWRRQGWELRLAEIAQEPVGFALDQKTTVQLTGRIDRIDYNRRLEQWAILDYKTGDAAKPPEKTHHNSRGEWFDLQLPLYRHLARAVGVEGNVRLGYITIPRDTDEVGAKLAEWSDEQLEQADDVARETARLILAEEFWKELERPPAYESEFAAVCQDNVFGKEATV